MSEANTNEHSRFELEQLEERCLLNAVVEGSERKDLFTVTVNESTIEVEVRNVLTTKQFLFEKSEIQGGITLLGKEARDRVVVNGSDENESAVLFDRSFDLNGPDYQIRGRSFVQIKIEGNGGDDSATLTGTDGTDRLFTNPDRVIFASRGLRKFLFDFEDVTVDASGGFDKADMFDSQRDDTFVAGPNEAQLLGGRNYNVNAKNFERVTIRSFIGGDDVAILNGDDRDDRFVGRPNGAIFRAVDQSYLIAVAGFERVTANGNGGNDIANLFGSNRDDSLVVRSDRTTIAQGRFTKTAADFDRVNVNGISLLASNRGGTDFAIIQDGKEDDVFVAKEDRAILIGGDGGDESSIVYLRGFESVRLVGNNGGENALRLARSFNFDLFVFGDWETSPSI